MLTVQAYDETPASIHKFLPIVSLGDELDKEIQWAEMVADEQGNYYYTSFSHRQSTARFSPQVESGRKVRN